MNIHPSIRIAAAATMCMTGAVLAAMPSANEMGVASKWVESHFAGKSSPTEAPSGLIVLANHDPVQRNARNGAPLKIADTEYKRGLYCHANSKIIVKLPAPGGKYTAVAGVDAAAPPGTVVFSVDVAGKKVFESPLMRGGMPGVPVEVDLHGAREFVIAVADGGDGIAWDQSDWANAKVTLNDGRELWLGDMPFLGTWDLFSTGPFFSFSYDGKPSSEFIGAWKVTRSKRSMDANKVAHVLTYRDPATGLEVRADGIEYKDYPTVEWTLHFKNTGAKDTPIISDIQAVDIGMSRGDGPEYLLHHNNGSETGPGDYKPIETPLGPNSDKVVAASNGRPTEANMPFFNIDTGNSGMIVVLGWPGQWSARFRRDASNGLRIQGGQELTHFRLHPGEEVRTPLVVLQFWGDGDWIRAQNVWRRWMVAHNVPRPGGKLQPPHLAACSSHQFAEMQNATEENQNLFIDRYLEEKLPLDYWWMDAGWYINYGSWMNTGTWTVDPGRFPRGLRAISDHAHAKGVKTIVWFEPECVTPKTWIADNHPDWVLGPKGWTEKGHGDSSAWELLNLGNPEARQWLTSMLDQAITEQGIDLYRQDFRLGPLGAWRANDADDRQGITEIRHCEGYLANWDALQKQHPNMPIDSCAAGGRRNELEAMRRAVPLLRSDYILEPLGNQCHTYGISFWLPLYGTGVNTSNPYDFRSVMCPMLNACYDVRRKDLDYDAIRRLMAQWKQVSQYFLGDYYPLTPYSQDARTWIAWQFDKPETGEGMIEAFRRDKSFYVSASLCLRGLEPAARYTVTDLDTNTSAQRSGKELMESGLNITIPDKPGSALIIYKKN